MNDNLEIEKQTFTNMESYSGGISNSLYAANFL